ncbi:MAG TPA: VWA domain-containing protein [Gaiellaceae bacterium]|nr:VWA domain-containing protein [Gaiellaceae bacterium]
MRFASPDMLVALLLVPAAVAGYLLLESRRTKRSANWSRPALLPSIASRPPGAIRHVPAVLFLIGLTFLLVGFAKPQRSFVSRDHAGAIVALTFDVSGSMAADDVAPTRIAAARRAAIQLINELPANDQVAVLTFADKVSLVVAPTTDRAKAIAGLPTTVTTNGGSALGEAIEEAVAVVTQVGGKSHSGNPHPPGAVVFLSDGAQTVPGPQPQDAAEHALVSGIPIDTVSVGTPNGIVSQVIPLTNGQTALQKIPVPVDSTALEEVSQVTNGTFFTAGSAAQLSRVYKNLGSHILRSRREHELNRVTAALALVFIFAGVALSGLWYSRLA